MRYIFLAQLFNLRVLKSLKKTDAHPSAGPDSPRVRSSFGRLSLVSYHMHQKAAVVRSHCLAKQRKLADLGLPDTG